MKPQNQYGMASDPADEDRLTKPDADIRNDDEDVAAFMPDDDDDGEISADDLDDDVLGDDADDDEQDDPEEKPDMDKDTSSLSDKAEMTHKCENCGKENFVLAPEGYRYKKTGEAKPAGLTQRLKHIGEALAPVFVFKNVYREARKPRQAPFLS